MGIRVYEDQGAGKLNEAVKACKVQSVGPITFVAHNEGSYTAVVGVYKYDSTTLYGNNVPTNRDTAVSAESTGYTGNGSTLAFSGQTLNNLPVVPGTTILTPATSGPSLIDKYGDGRLITNDADLQAAGTINYFTGALTLSYPTGKAPDGLISANYAYQNSVLRAGGKKTFSVTNVPLETDIVARVASSDVKGSFVRIDGIATWE